MSESKDETKTRSAGDKELDELLDSALQDMVPPQPRKDSIGGSSIKDGAIDGVEWNPSENVWSEEFLQNAAATFQSNMAALITSMKGTSDDPISQEQISATFQMMAEAAAQVMKPGDSDNGQADPPIDDGTEKPKAFSDVNAAIAQTLESLNANTDSLQDPFNEENLNKMFSGLKLANPEVGTSFLFGHVSVHVVDFTHSCTSDDVHMEDGSGSNVFVPFMQEMMQSLLSKEVLYPSLKDIVDKYPMWLMDNKDKLSPEDFERYTKQNKLMANVCSELESENDSDPEDVKKKRFEKVLGLMQQMQELGQPPEELAGDNADMLAPSLPMGDMAPMGDPNQCKPM